MKCVLEIYDVFFCWLNFCMSVYKQQSGDRRLQSNATGVSAVRPAFQGSTWGHVMGINGAGRSAGVHAGETGTGGRHFALDVVRERVARLTVGDRNTVRCEKLALEDNIAKENKRTGYWKVLTKQLWQWTTDYITSGRQANTKQLRCMASTAQMKTSHTNPKH